MADDDPESGHAFVCTAHQMIRTPGTRTCCHVMRLLSRIREIHNHKTGKQYRV